MAIAGSVAQAASAAEFEGDANPAILKAEQITTNELSFETGIVKCTGAVFETTVSAFTFTTVSFHPTYTGCKLAGMKAEVNTLGCNYTLHTTTTLLSGAVTATVDTQCSKESAITISKEGCTIKVPGQEGLSHIILTNTNEETAKKDVDAELTVTGISYTESGSTCAKPGAHNGGAMFGKWTIREYTEDISGDQFGLWVV